MSNKKKRTGLLGTGAYQPDRKDRKQGATIDPGTLSGRLRQVREMRNLSPEALSASIGVDTSKVTAWENGTEEPTFYHIASIAAALNVPPEHFQVRAKHEDPTIQAEISKHLEEELEQIGENDRLMVFLYKNKDFKTGYKIIGTDSYEKPEDEDTRLAKIFAELSTAKKRALLRDYLADTERSDTAHESKWAARTTGREVTPSDFIRIHYGETVDGKWQAGDLTLADIRRSDRKLYDAYVQRIRRHPSEDLGLSKAPTYKIEDSDEATSRRRASARASYHKRKPD